MVGSALREGPNVFLAAVVRSDVISYTTGERITQGRGTLIENEVLNAAAQAKAEDMAARGYFSHVGPDGKQPWKWLESAGYDYIFAGENLAVRFDDSKNIVDAWMASPTHRANIVKPQYKEIGVGIAQGMYKGSQTTFVVQFFASPAKTTPVPATTGPVSVVPDDGGPTVAGAETQVPDAGAGVVRGPQNPVQSASQEIIRAVSQPRVPATWILWGVAALLAGVLLATFFVRIQVQPTDLLYPGAAVAAIAVLLLGANATFLPPAPTQSAAPAHYAPVGVIDVGVATERAPLVVPEEAGGSELAPTVAL